MSKTAKTKIQKNNHNKKTAGNTVTCTFVTAVSGFLGILLFSAILSVVLSKMPDPDLFIMPASAACMFLSGTICSIVSRKGGEKPAVCAIFSDIVILLLLCLTSVFCKSPEIETSPVFGAVNIASLVIPSVIFSCKKKKERKRKSKKMPA